MSNAGDIETVCSAAAVLVYVHFGLWFGLLAEIKIKHLIQLLN